MSCPALSFGDERRTGEQRLELEGGGLRAAAYRGHRALAQEPYAVVTRIGQERCAADNMANSLTLKVSWKKFWLLSAIVCTNAAKCMKTITQPLRTHVSWRNCE
jgi:hypothetical protein